MSVIRPYEPQHDELQVYNLWQHACPFFQACGWIKTERSFDLIGDLADYTTPIGVYERLSNSSTTIASVTPADIPAILAFEEGH